MRKVKTYTGGMGPYRLARYRYLNAPLGAGYQRMAKDATIDAGFYAGLRI
jgi:hypothetical protein